MRTLTMTPAMMDTGALPVDEAALSHVGPVRPDGQL